MLAPLARLNVISKTIAFTIKENKPKVNIVNGRDNNFKIGLIIAFTKTNNKAVINRAFVSVKEIPENKKSSTYKLIAFTIHSTKIATLSPPFVFINFTRKVSKIKFLKENERKWLTLIEMLL